MSRSGGLWKTILTTPVESSDLLGLGSPSVRHLIGGMLLAIGGLPVAWLLGSLQSFIPEIPEEFFAALEGLIRADGMRGSRPPAFDQAATNFGQRIVSVEAVEGVRRSPPPDPG